MGSSFLRWSIALLLIASSACGVRFKEDLPASDPMKLGDTGTACLNGSSKVIENYLNGESSDQEVARVWDCVNASLSRFTDEVRGAEAGQYKPEELKWFLEKYFLKGVSIPDGLMKEAMVLKRTLLGGTLDRLTVVEIGKLQRLLELLKKESLALQKWMPLSIAKVAKLEPGELVSLVGDLQTAASELGSVLEATGNAYTFEDLESFHDESYKFLKDETRVPEHALFKQYGPLLRLSKAILVGPGEDRIGGDEWARLLSAAAGWFGVFARAEHLRDHRASVLSGEDRQISRAMATEAIRLIDAALAQQPGQVIAFETLDRLIDLSVQAKLFEGLAVSPGNLKALLRPVVQRVLGGTASGDTGRQAAGLTRPALGRFNDAFEQWAEGQKYLELLFAKAEASLSQNDITGLGILPDDLVQFTVNEVTGTPFDEQTLNAKRGIISLYQVIRKHPALFGPKGTEISFDNPERRLSFHDLSTKHWLSAVSKLLFEGYSESPEILSGRYQSGVSRLQLTRKEFSDLYNAFRPVGIELKFFDPDKKDVPEKRFSDANLFTYVADGNELLDLDEGVEIFALMLSGKQMAARAHKALAAECEQSSEHDKFGKPRIIPGCYREKFFGNLSSFWNGLPGMASFYSSLPQDAKEQFSHDLEHTARASGYSDLYFDSADSETIAMLGQYIEMLFMRFDLDRSGTINPDEAEKVFPVVRSVLAKRAPGHGDATLEGILTYFLNYGRAPEDTRSGKAHLAQWIARKRFWSFEADRSRVLQIFMTLSRPAPMVAPILKMGN